MGGDRMIELITQPFEGQLGTILKDKLMERKYQHFVIVSAFAKNSGVLRMKDSLQAFRKRGGKIDAFIGLDAYGTSYEAVVNLFSLADSLYLVHDNNPGITFHSKIYYLTDHKDHKWIAVGSNNFTGGGLWTNHETANIVSKDSPTDTESTEYFNQYIKLIARYKETNCRFSMKITSIRDLDKLLKADLLRHEIVLQMDAAKARYHTTESTGKNTPQLFGSMGKVPLPTLKSKDKSKQVKIHGHNVEVKSLHPIVPSDNSEKMWFETRKMTGGSRNILDLSMLGNLARGSADGTKYQTDNDHIVLGSVVFFDIDPTNTSCEKNITINYNAKDYAGCTIKMHNTGANPNGSWRIQLKGETTSGEKLTTAEGGDWFVHKVIVLEKIRTDYYTMSVLPESELNALTAESIFTARNGNTPASKQYGLLNI